MPRKVFGATLTALALVVMTAPAGAVAKDKDGGDAASRAETRGGWACSPEFIDTAGERWDIDGDEGEVEDGTDDAYDDLGYVEVGDQDNRSWVEYYNDAESCTFEENGRELVLPFQELTFNDDERPRGIAPQPTTVEMQRKIYVPSTGLPFARFLDVIRNPGDEPVTLDYNWWGEYGSIGGVLATSDGDGDVDLGERWGAFAHSSDGSQVASLWDGPGADGWDTPYDDDESLPGEDQDYVDLVYRRITIPAGGTVALMHIEHQRTDADLDDRAASDDVVAFAEAYGDGHADFFAGLSNAEIVALRNWKYDLDRDGVLDHVDNCDTAGNADQADLDGDGEGDACDADRDNDGVPNAVEAGIGSNPNAADSDGDGKADGLDSCPTLAGATPNGCPPPTVTVNNVVQQIVVGGSSSTGRALPTGVTLNVRISRGAKASRSRSRARKSQSSGVTVRTTGRIELPPGVATSACANGQVAVLVKQSKKTISTRVVNVADDCTYRSTVTFRRKLRGRSVRVKSYFFGSRGLVGRAAKSKVASLR